MKRLVILLCFICAIAGACSATQPPKPVDLALARASVIHMGYAVQGAARQCTAHGQWLAKFGPAQEENADRLYETCTRTLTPARDAVVFAPDRIDPWTPKSAGVIGCTGRAVRTALEALRRDFVTFRVREPEVMTDGIHVGRWAEQWALPNCDPMHPTTTVDMYEDPNIPRIDPTPPPLSLL